ncbi:M24 family metallopeptidase [Micrococcales bacterium 31B]|nr:M24 family metallopeptidase [Micrococcales bacterium 31B]
MTLETTLPAAVLPLAPVPALDLAKVQALQELARSCGADGITLTTQPSLGWLLGGGRLHVSLAAPPLVAATISADAPRDDALTVYATNNEADRLALEELPPNVRIHPVPWYASVTAEASRADYLTEACAEAELTTLRQRLGDADLAAYGALCREAAQVMTRVLETATPYLSERELARELAAQTLDLGADPLVVLVGGESRRRHRHPLPTDAPLGDRALAVLCARRQGLIANVSRWVQFSPQTEAQIRYEGRITAIEKAFLDASVPGARLSDAFAAGCAAYGRVGYDDLEWRNHHQGGVAGFAGRDPRGTELTDCVLPDRFALAWNPSSPNTKIEDTILRDGETLTVLTHDPRWPTQRVGELDRPLPLVLA